MRKSILLLTLAATVATAACASPSAEAESDEETVSTQQAFGGILYPVPPRPPIFIPPPPPAPLAPFWAVGGYAGMPGTAGHRDGSSQTLLVNPTHVATTYDGATWVLDEDPANPGETSLRIVFDTYNTISPHVQTILKGASPWDLNLIRGMAVDPATLDLYGSFGVANQIYKITLRGEMVLFAGANLRRGEWTNEGSNDGDPLTARFSSPAGIVRDAQGTLYVADRGNRRIRIVSSTGVVSTLPLVGAPAGFTPTALARDARNGTLYTAWGHAVYAIAWNGQVSLFAGDPNAAGFVNGTPASARFNTPEGIAVDRSGNVHVADSGNATLRKIRVDWGTSALAVESLPYLQDTPLNGIGNGGYGWADRVMIKPVGLSFWGDTLLVTDPGRHTVRRVF
jgi:hypothetical protein